MASSDVIRRVADRHAKRWVDPLVAALARGVVDVSALTSAFERGDRAAAMRIALESVDPQHLRVLVAQVNLTERMLDVMQEAGDATRCDVRPTAEAAAAFIETTPPTAIEAADRASDAAEELVRSLRVAQPMPTRAVIEKSVKSYVSDSTPINEALREGSALPQWADATAGDLSAAIANTPLPESKVLYRAVPKNVADGWPPGSTMTDPAFVSTSKNPRFIDLMERDGYDVDDFVMVEIRVPQGTGALDVNATLGPRHAFAEQQEVILGPGMRFAVTQGPDGLILSVVGP